MGPSNLHLNANPEHHPGPGAGGERALGVLLVNRALPAHVPGGLERHVHDLALGLAAAGCRVHLLAAPLPEAERARYAALGVATHAMACARPRRYSLGYLAGAGRAINEILSRNAIDVIHAQEFALGFWTPPPGGPPLAVTVHGTITSETPLHPDVYRQLGPSGRVRAWLRYGRRFLYAPAWGRALRRAGRILVDSDFTRGELARLHPEVLEKVRRVPLGVREPGAEPPPYEEARARLGWGGGQTRLLTTGRLEWQKGHEIALEALAGLRDYAWHYTIAGAGAGEAALRRAIARLGLQQRVTLAGWVDEETKRLMLAGADLFLWPERTHPAFGLAGLEALLASTPVLATRRGAIPEVLGPEGAWLVERCEAGAFRAGLEPLLAGPERLRAARPGLRQAALARCSFEAMIEATLAQYRELVAQRF